MPLLADLTVLELPGNYGVRFCGKLLADLGARVTRVTFADSDPGEVVAQDVAADLFVDIDKEEVVVDRASGEQMAALATMVREADVLLASEIPAEVLRTVGISAAGGTGNPGQVFAVITDFGFDGPFAGYRGTSMLGHAASGYLFLNGDEDKPPLRGLEYHPYAQTGLSAFLGIVAALYERRESGQGQTVSTSVMQTLAPMHEWTSVRYTHGGIIQKREGNRYGLGHPIAIYPTLDGYFCITVVDQQRSNMLLALAGHPEAVEDPRFASAAGRRIHMQEYDSLIVDWFRSTPNEQLIQEFETIKLTAAPVLALSETLGHPHFREREFWRGVELPDGRRAEIPGRPVRLLKSTEGGGSESTRGPQPGDDRRAGPLSGLRVVDLTTGWSGPHGLRMLGDLGADVVRVEPPWQRGTVPPDEEYVHHTGFYMDNDPGEKYWMRSGAYNKWAYNKRCVALRMNEPEGREVLRRLVQWADVVIENFSTQAWEKLGVTYDWLSSVNPRIVAVTMPGYGRWGPAKYRVSYGNQVEAVIGADSLMGYEGGEPHMFCQAWPDPCAGVFAAAYALVGIMDRDKTGRGHFFEVSQTEAALSFMGPEVALCTLDGRDAERPGNRHHRYAPHGVYRCRGEERWLAVAVTSDEEWQALCGVIGRDDLAQATELSTAAGRQEHRTRLDAAIGEWTAGCDYKEAMGMLQGAGVPAFAAYDAPDMVGDEFLRSVGAFHEVYGETLPGFSFQLSRTPPAVYRPVPDVGEHNQEVLLSLDYTAEEVEGLLERRILADRPTM